MSTNKSYKTILYSPDKVVAKVYLNRPEVHNAFNDTMITELLDVFDIISRNDELRVVVLTGMGKSFCAGADLNWMKKIKEFSYEQNVKETLLLSELMYRIYSLPKPTIARVNGAAIGGGTGFVATCDLVISAKDAKFSFSEVKIGVVPACISPYVIKKVGEPACREFFLTGERLTASRLQQAGLINQVVPLDKLDQAVEERIQQLLSCGPRALSVCKKLLQHVPTMALDTAKSYTAELLASLRTSEEAQEGMLAFLEKRKPKWVIER